jgi:hypothetical protein
VSKKFRTQLEYELEYESWSVSLPSVPTHVPMFSAPPMSLPETQTTRCSGFAGSIGQTCEPHFEQYAVAPTIVGRSQT